MASDPTTTAASRKPPLSTQDVAALAVKCRNLVEAHERRHPDSRWPTISERAALEELRADLASLERNRRV